MGVAVALGVPVAEDEALDVDGAVAVGLWGSTSRRPPWGYRQRRAPAAPAVIVRPEIVLTGVIVEASLAPAIIPSEVVPP